MTASAQCSPSALVSYTMPVQRVHSMHLHYVSWTFSTMIYIGIYVSMYIYIYVGMTLESGLIFHPCPYHSLLSQKDQSPVIATGDLLIYDRHISITYVWNESDNFSPGQTIVNAGEPFHKRGTSRWTSCLTLRGVKEYVKKYFSYSKYTFHKN